MNFEDVEKLINLMQRYELNELQVKEEGWEFSARRGEKTPVVAHPAPPAPVVGPPLVAGTAGKDQNLKEITSPIVGTFYRAPAPDQPHFKEVGDRVGPDDVVCIVEAMKVMNEIKAGLSGTIRKILVENSTAVEFGQPLFQVEA